MTAQGTFAGYSGILVGSTQITAYTTSQYVHRPSSKVKPGIVIQGDLLQVGLKDIHVAQLDAELSVWFTNNNDAAGYYHVDTSSSLSDGRLVSLLSEGDGGRLSGMMTTANLGDATVSVNTIISVDESGHLTSLQQSTLAGSWDAYPLMMSTKVANFKVQSYTTRLRVMTDGNNPAGNATFTLTSSGRVSAIINGKENYVDPNGITMKTDASGETTFIVATADVSSHTFQISNVTGADGKDLAIDLQTVDPSGKSMTRLKGITDGPSLKDATTQKGNKLIDPSGLDEDTINQAGTIIKQLYDHSQTLTPGQPPLKSRQAFKVSPSFKAQQPCDDSKPSNSGKELPKSIKAVTVGSVEETAGEWWHWVTQKADEAETWIIDTASRFELHL